MKSLREIPFVLRTIISWYVFVFITVQFLSVFSLLSREYILFSNLIFWIVVIYFSSTINIKFRKVDIYEVLIGILLGLTFIQGFFSAPNTTDSMVYHLPRVMYWIQEKSAFQSQIVNSHDYMGPFAEYLLTHLYVIFNSDRLLFFSQWLAYLGTILVVGEIAKLLGSTRKLIQLVRIMVATLPMAVLQATSTQTDMVSAFLFILSLYFALLFWFKENWNYFLMFVLVLALGILAKSTLLIFGVIPSTIVGWRIVKSESKLINKITYILFSSLIFILILFQFLYQNMMLFGSFLGYQSGEYGKLVLTNEVISVPEFLSNILRNIFLQIPIPMFYKELTLLLTNFHQIIGIDINDPRTTWYGTQFRVNSIIFPQEDLAANVIQFLLFVIAGIFVFKKSNYTILKNLYLLVVVVFFLFALFIKWQPWHSRLHLPLIVLMTLIGVLILQKREFFLNICVIVAYLLALLVILFNYSRPFISYHPFKNIVQTLSVEGSNLPESIYLKPRNEQYFNPRPYWYNSYDHMTSSIANNPEIKKISLDLFDDYQYPIWYFLKQKNPGVKIEPKNVNDQKFILYSSKSPDARINNLECLKSEKDYGYICIGEKIL